jgi:catalase
MFWKSLTANEQAHLASAVVFELSKCSLEHVRIRVMANLRNVDEDLARRVAAGLAMDLPQATPPARAPIDLPPSDALSIQKKWQPTLKGRKVGILFAEGSDKAAIDTLIEAITGQGGTPVTSAPKVGGSALKGGTMKADGQLAGSPSCQFDAVALVLAEDAARKLCRDGAAVAFVLDAFGHLKAIGHDAGARALLDRAGVEPDEGVTDLASLPRAATLRYWDREPKVRDLA